MLFGRLLKQIRKRKGYTSQQLADALHVSRSTYSRYENDLKDVEPDILLSLANFYDTTVDDFLLWNALIKSPDLSDERQQIKETWKIKIIFRRSFLSVYSRRPRFLPKSRRRFFRLWKSLRFRRLCYKPL